MPSLQMPSQNVVSARPSFVNYLTPRKPVLRFGSLQAYEETGEYMGTGDYLETSGLGTMLTNVWDNYRMPILIAGGLAALWYAKKKRMF